MLPALLLFLLGLVILTIGAEWLVRGSAALALSFGIPSLVVGLTVVAFGTSSPELAVSIRAAITGQSDIALGNVIGSNSCNVGLILGLAAVIRPLQIHSSIIKREIPILLFAVFVLILFLSNRLISRPEGMLLVGFLLFYLTISFVMSKKSDLKSDTDLPEIHPMPRWKQIVLLGIGLAGLILGANLMVANAIKLAQMARLSEAFIGLTIVAIGTSLPELATSVIAAIRKENDIAVGNVIGSNIFNIFAILGISSAIHPLSAMNLGWIDVGVMSLFALLLLPLLRSGFVLDRKEGLFLLLAFVLYNAYLLINAI
jgi:cation:H+ antiporter